MAQLESNAMEHVVRKEGYENMPLATLFFLMVDRPQPQLGFHASKGVFDVREHGIDIPYFPLIKILSIGPQTVNAALLLPPPARPGDLFGIGALSVFLNRDLIAPGYPFVSLF